MMGVEETIEKIRDQIKTLTAENKAQAERIKRLEPVLKKKYANILRHETSDWDTTMNDNEVTCHHRMVEGVLCRWWGDGPTPDGVALIDAALNTTDKYEPNYRERPEPESRTPEQMAIVQPILDALDTTDKADDDGR